MSCCFQLRRDVCVYLKLLFLELRCTVIITRVLMYPNLVKSDQPSWCINIYSSLTCFSKRWMSQLFVKHWKSLMKILFVTSSEAVQLKETFHKSESGVEEEMDRCVDPSAVSSSAVMKTLHWSVLVTKELIVKVKLLIYWMIYYIPIRMYGMVMRCR